MKAIFIALILITLPIHHALAAAVNATDADDACYHNNFRDALSFGKTMGKLDANLDESYNFALQNRPATPLPSLTNNNTLKSSAAEVASSCVFAHSYMAGVGENLFVGTEPNTQTESNWLVGRNYWLENAVADWVYEAEIVNFPAGSSTVKCNDGSTGSSCRSKIGHYTQIMWDSTTAVGCAAQYCPSGISNFTSRKSTMVVCHYSPQGNHYDGTNYLAPYTGIGIQAPASNAPASSSCSSGGSGGGSNSALSAIYNLLLND